MDNNKEIIELYAKRIIQETEIESLEDHNLNDPEFYCYNSVIHSQSFNEMRVYFDENICSGIISYLIRKGFDCGEDLNQAESLKNLNQLKFLEFFAKKTIIYNNYKFSLNFNETFNLSTKEYPEYLACKEFDINYNNFITYMWKDKLFCEKFKFIKNKLDKRLIRAEG